MLSMRVKNLSVCSAFAYKWKRMLRIIVQSVCICPAFAYQPPKHWKHPLSLFSVKTTAFNRKCKISKKRFDSFSWEYVEARTNTFKFSCFSTQAWATYLLHPRNVLVRHAKCLRIKSHSCLSPSLPDKKLNCAALNIKINIIIFLLILYFRI